MIGRKDMGCAETQIGPKTGQIMKKIINKTLQKSIIKIEKFSIFKGGEGSRGIYLIAPESG